MKKSLFISLTLLPALLGTSCNDDVSKVNVYRKAGIVDKTISIRYFKDSPNVPYISVSDFYKEFFSLSFTKLHNLSTGYEYLYMTPSREYISFSTKKHTLTTNGISSFDNNPNYSTTTGKLFIKYDSYESSNRQATTINLNNYNIKLYERKKECYAPLTLLSDLTGGLSGVDIVYNNKNIYVFDNHGYLGSKISAASFGSAYLTSLNDISETRPQDLVNFNYNELCLVFDNLRGHTKQLVFGDEKLESLGLDKLLSTYHPKIKEYLLSSDKQNYYEGLTALFNGLADGGHTGLIFSFDALANASQRKSDQDFGNLIDIRTEASTKRAGLKSSFYLARYTLHDIAMSSNKYYLYNSDYKTAYIGFDSFDLDVTGWDNYYKGKGDVPVDTDTYAYVRKQMYRALEDGAENVILDLTTNGGGSTYSLEGILGLFNKAKGYVTMQDVIGGYIVKENHLIDVNLDGSWDDRDKAEVNKFNFNVGVLCSNCAFSCGNLLPYNMKELGYKILGEKTGGGSCAVSLDTTADGIPYAHSSYICLTDNQGDNIDGGVGVDFEIPRPETEEHLYNCDSYFDFASISEYISHAYSK